jgi:Fic family protein
MNASDFTQPSGKLVNEMWGDQAYLAFVPQPLPPSFGYDPAFVKTLAEAVHKLGELAGLGRLVPNPNLLANPFKRREAVLSSRIEGTHTDVMGLYAYEAGQLSLFRPDEPVRSSNDAREVYNYLQALNHGLLVLQMTLLFIEWRLLPAPLLYLSAYFEQNRVSYYDLLLDVSRRGRWREWTKFSAFRLYSRVRVAPIDSQSYL